MENDKFLIRLIILDIPISFMSKNYILLFTFLQKLTKISKWSQEFRADMYIPLIKVGLMYFITLQSTTYFLDYTVAVK